GPLALGHLSGELWKCHLKRHDGEATRASVVSLWGMDEVPEEDPFELLTVSDPEAPEADTLEQSEVVEVRQALDGISADPEAPEADALDQSEVVIGMDPEQEQ
ncbi:MAG: hypothetical protein LC749_16845, partial [Actinobacteria bacterium]|nr:hypothetical protein [Actinomycetota bacterium]